LTADFHNLYPVDRVLTRIPINDNATKDIEIDVDITLQDFVGLMCANMGLNPTAAKIGWKSNDDAECAPARKLVTEDDLKAAFCDLLELKNNTRRTKEVFMHIIHLVGNPCGILALHLLFVLESEASRSSE
jgi:hypothetical protein